MPVARSPYFQDPYMGQITTNLATALFGDPGARQRAALYGSETSKNYALENKTEAETAGLNIKNDATRGLPGTLGRLFAPLQPGETPQSRAADIAGLLQAGGGNASELASGLQTGLGTLFTTSNNDDDMRHGLIIEGKNPDKNFAGTAARADQISARDAKEAQDKGVAEENIKAASAAKVAGINQAGENTRAFAKPIEMNPGQTVVIPQSNPNHKTLGDKLFGGPTKQTIEGQAGARIAAGQGGVDDPYLYSGSVKAGQPGGGNGGKPTQVNGKILDQIALAALGNVQGAVDRRAPNHPVVSSDFLNAVDPQKKQAAELAATQTYQQTGDVGKAAAAYLTGLGVQAGAHVEAPGLLGNLFGAKPTIVPAQPSNLPTLPATPLPQTAAPALPPPPAQRPVGFRTTIPGKGDFEWSGTGWVPAKVY